MQHPQLACIINGSRRPLLISDSSKSNPRNVLSLAYLLDSKVRYRFVPDERAPIIRADFSDVFVFHPSNSLRQDLEKQGRYRLVLVHKSGLWQLK